MSFVSEDQYRKESAAWTAKGGNEKEYLDYLLKRGDEIEGLNARFDTGKMISNILPSAGRFARDLASVVVAYKPDETGKKSLQFTGDDTVKAFLDLGEGLVQKAVSGAFGLEKFGSRPDKRKAVDAVTQFVTQRYGSLDRAINTLEEDPVGAVSDAFAVVSGLGAGAKAGLKGAAVLQKFDRLAPIVKGAEKAVLGIEKAQAGLKAVDPVSRAGKAVQELVRETNKALGVDKFLRDRIRRIGSTALFPGDQAGTGTRDLTKKLGENAGEWLASHRLAPKNLEDLSRQLDVIAGASKKAVDEGLAQVNGRIRNPVVKDAIHRAIQTVKRFDDPDFSKLTGDLENLLLKHEYGENASKVAAMVSKAKRELLAAAKAAKEVRKKEGKAVLPPLKADVDIGSRFELAALAGLVGEVYKPFVDIPKGVASSIEHFRAEIAQMAKPLKLPASERGVTLTELNEVLKRGFFQQTQSLFKQKTGEGLAGLPKTSLRNYQKAIRRIIEDEAAARGFTNVRELNRETKVARDIKEVVDNDILANPGRSGVVKRAINTLGLGTVGISALYFSPQVAALFGGVTVLAKVAASPRFKFNLSKALHFLSGEELRRFESGIRVKDLKNVSKADRNLIARVLNATLKQTVKRRTQPVRVAGTLSREIQKQQE